MEAKVIKNESTVHTCACCGQIIENEDCVYIVRLADGTHVEWCDECIYSPDSSAMYCDHCDEWVVSDSYRVETHTYNWYRTATEHWCESCVEDDAVRCDCCGELFEYQIIDSYELYDGRDVSLCRVCRDDEYVTCDGCGNLVPNDDYWYDERHDCRYCPNCEDEHQYSDNMHGYHHTGGTYFWLDNGEHKYYCYLSDEESKLMYLGIELETDYNDSADEVADAIAYWYDGDAIECKEDGSLDEEGVEIVSQPMTPLHHLTSDMWERITSIVKEHGGKSHDAGTCGLHIHISRAYFKDHDAVYRLDRLFHVFERQFIEFSRRSGSQMDWCEIDDDSELRDEKDVEDRKAIWYRKKNSGYRARYQAVNDTNYNTVEIRLWRGTLNVETIRATIEMTTGLAIVANSMSDELAETLTWGMLKLLVRFALEQNGLPHDDLDAYLSRRHL